MTVDVKFETTEQTSELGPKFLSTVQPQLKMRRNNPFRNPVIRKPDEQNVRVVSRYRTQRFLITSSIPLKNF